MNPVEKFRDSVRYAIGTPRQKAGNRRVGRKRVAVEHGIGKVQVWRIAAERRRNPRRRHTLVMKNVAGLHNRMFAE